MVSTLPLRLVLVWHMHQPDFRDFATGEFNHPWVYLHAIKDYSDMAAHLEQHPTIRAVVNLVPILLDQLDDYADQFASGHIRDRLLRLLITEDLDDIDPSDRRFLLDQCFRANHTKMVEPYAPYRRLQELYNFVQAHGSDCIEYLSGQYLADLVTWYHLAWTGETVRRREETIVQLMSKGEGFTAAERRQLFELFGAVIRDIVPRYRRLAELGRIELSTTPYFHPIGPLMLDFTAARDSLPDGPLPHADHYPGGRSRLA
ncbi:MAG: glycoside hydrolase, partial [Proteobacteria bacterium]